MSDSDTGITRQGKGIFVGIIFIIWAVVGALISYASDSDSFDIVRMLDASQNAIVHFVIWAVLGGGVILWYWMGPGSARQRSDDNGRDRDGAN